MRPTEALATLGIVPLNRELTRRSLWGSLPRRLPGGRSPALPEGRPTLALSFDLDYQADTDALPDLLLLLGGAGAKATLFCIGALVERDSAPYRAAAEAGHEIANHTQTHPDNPVLNPDHEFWHLDVATMADEIGRCQDTLARLTGVRPCGFRTPHFKDARRMTNALARYPEITYVSTALASKSPRTTPYFPTRNPALADLALHYPAPRGGEGFPQLMIPLTPCPGLRWSPFCSYSSIRRPANPAKGAGLHDVPTWERLWDVMLEGAHHDRFASVYFDPFDVMRDDETKTAFARMLRGAAAKGWEVTTLAEIERRWRPLV